MALLFPPFYDIVMRITSIIVTNLTEPCYKITLLYVVIFLAQHNLATTHFLCAV